MGETQASSIGASEILQASRAKPNTIRDGLKQTYSDFNSQIRDTKNHEDTNVMRDRTKFSCNGISSNKRTISSLKKKRGKAERKISMEDLRPYFCTSLMEAAISLGVSRSTLKRKCRKFGVSQWPSSKGNKRSYRTPGSKQLPRNEKIDGDLTRSDELGKIRLPLDSAPSQFEAFNSVLIQDINRQAGVTSIVKATYKEDMTRFHFSSKSNVIALKEELVRRLDLELGTFKMKYLDEDDEWALLTCDSDWKDCLCISRSNKRNLVRLLIQDL